MAQYLVYDFQKTGTVSYLSFNRYPLTVRIGQRFQFLRVSGFHGELKIGEIRPAIGHADAGSSAVYHVDNGQAGLVVLSQSNSAIYGGRTVFSDVNSLLSHKSDIKKA